MGGAEEASQVAAEQVVAVEAQEAGGGEQRPTASAPAPGGARGLNSLTVEDTPMAVLSVLLTCRAGIGGGLPSTARRWTASTPRGGHRAAVKREHCGGTDGMIEEDPGGGGGGDLGPGALTVHCTTRSSGGGERTSSSSSAEAARKDCSSRTASTTAPPPFPPPGPSSSRSSQSAPPPPSAAERPWPSSWMRMVGSARLLLLLCLAMVWMASTRLER